MPLLQKAPDEAIKKYGEYWGDTTIADRLAEFRERQPEKAALIDGDLRLSYEEVGRQVDSFAAALHEIGIRHGDVVALMLPNWWEACVAHLALIQIGAITNPIIPIYRERELSYILRDAEAKAIVLPGDFRGVDFLALYDKVDAPGVEHVIVCRDEPRGNLSFDALLEKHRGQRHAAEVDADEVSLLLYTSGTTSNPKGVLHTHNTLVAELNSYIDLFDANIDDVVFIPVPITHISGLLYGIQLPFFVGGTTIMLDTWSAKVAAEIVEREGVTYMGGPTPILHEMTYNKDTEGHDLSTIRFFGCGGAGVPPQLIRDAIAKGFPAFRAYGSSEHPIISGGSKVDPEKAATTDGKVHPHVELRLMDINDPSKEAAPGQPGEIVTKGPDLMIGYNRPELNDEAFDADGWFHTGDVGSLDEEGFLTIVGRIKEIIIRKGENISAKEIEDVLVEHPAVSECAVIGLPDPERGERVCACVVLAEGQSLTLDEMTGHVLDSGMAKQKVPEQLEIVEALPKNPTGKVKKFELVERFSDS